MTGPVNMCSACGEDFISVSAFDEHRTGVHEYTYLEGVKKEPPVEDGRRCLGVDELRAFGWSRRSNGLWNYPRDWVKQASHWDHAIPEAERVEAVA